MYDPVSRARAVERHVSDVGRRKYHRFRGAKFYGGIATADCVGCCLDCVFCWSWRQARYPERYGEFLSPREVARELTALARKRGFQRVRISGNEPTLARDHLLGVLERVPPDLLFILETNGIPIGHDRTFAEDLARFRNLQVRVSLKGANEAEFARLTGADPSGFGLQIASLGNLIGAGVRAHPAVMVSFSSEENLSALRRRLSAISSPFEDFEVEELTLYGHVRRRLDEAGIPYRSTREPGYP